jgi:hypothetical protein
VENIKFGSCLNLKTPYIGTVPVSKIILNLIFLIATVILDLISIFGNFLFVKKYYAY